MNPPQQTPMPGEEVAPGEELTPGEELAPGEESADVERRSAPREPIRLGVHFDTSDDLARAVEATTRNIGLGGLCLKTARSYERGDPLRLFIELGDEDTLVVAAVVAWSRPGVAIGVRFEGLSEVQRQRLAQVLARRRSP